jgi:RND family efflux transporter MFP subunit
MKNSHVLVRWPVAVGAAVLLVAIGAIASYVVVGQRGRSQPQLPISAVPAAQASPRSAETIISLTTDAVKRAGIEVAPLSTLKTSDTLRLPAVVEPNAYKQVTVTPVVSGRITRVLAELGAEVQQGQTLTTVFSPELAEAQTRYVSTNAELAAHERELARTEKLVQLGSASRQELERIHAEHTAQRTNLESARSRLELLGVSREVVTGLETGQPITARTDVPAPISGIVTERLANVGLNVDSSTRLFTIVDLSNVWVIASLYESDFSRVRVGDRAAISFPAYSDRQYEGVVSYLDPQVSLDTRTAKVRIEVSNPRRELRMGMLGEAQIKGSEATAGVASIPKVAVQNIGDRSFVYVRRPSAPTEFIEREVRLGASSGNEVHVLSGLNPGEQVVTQGSFFVRAERDRLGLPPAPSSAASVPMNVQRGTPAGQSAKIVVNEKGFEPSQVKLKAGVAARLTFVRTTDKTCATEIVFPSLKIKRALPLNQPVDIDFTPAKNIDASFACGMNMFKGAVVVVE